MRSVDPAVPGLLEELPRGLALSVQTPAELRARLRTAVRICEGPRFRPDLVDRVQDRVIRGDNGEIPIRVYAAADRDPTAVILYVHGGSWIAGDLETQDKVARRLCVAVEAAVVSVDYRLAPEHPYPAGFQDCWDSLLWAASLHPRLPLLVAGDGAGGALAAGVALRARDERGPQLAGQVLVCPRVDDDADTDTMHQYGGLHTATSEDFATINDWYLTGRLDRSDPYAVPGSARALDGLPPTMIAIAGCDPLRSSQERYVERLRGAGVPVVVQEQPTLVHGWLDFFPRVPAARRALDDLAEGMRSLIAQGSPLPGRVDTGAATDHPTSPHSSVGGRPGDANTYYISLPPVSRPTPSRNTTTTARAAVPNQEELK